MKMRLLPILLAAACAPASCRKSAPPAARPPRPVIAAEAAAREVPVYIDQIGRCVPIENVMIRPQISGPVTAIHFTDGMDLKVGDPLFTIDPRPFQAASDAAVARYSQEQARAQFDIAQLRRNQKLSDRQVVSPQDLDSARSAELASQAGLEEARAKAQTAKISLDYCQITSPIAGRAGKRLVDIGNIVEANKTDMLQIQCHMPIHIEFIIPENTLPRVRKYMADRALEIQASLPDDPASARTGKLNFIDAGVKPDSGTILLRGIFDNKDQFFWPGQFVHVRLVLDQISDAVLIPAQALQTGADSSFVFVIGDDNTARVRPVKYGQLHGREIVITEGLSKGERVVATGQVGLSDGAPVKVVQPVTAP